MIKWNKKTCIEYLTQIKSPMEGNRQGTDSSSKTPIDVLTRRMAIRQMMNAGTQEIKGNGSRTRPG